MAARPDHIQKLTLMVNAKTQKLQSDMKHMNRQMGQMKTMAKSLAVGFGSVFAVSRIKDFIAESVRLADVQLKAEAQLKTALKGDIQAYEKLISIAKERQKLTLYGDEETIRAQSLIAALVDEADQVAKITPLVQDLAAAKKMDLAAAADLISKTLGSSTNALSRYGIEVTGAVGSTERLETLTQNLTRAFGGQAEALAKAGLGPLKQFENAWGDLREELGKKLIPLLNKVVSFFKEIVDNSGEIASGLDPTIKAFQDLGAALGQFTGSTGVSITDFFAGLVKYINYLLWPLRAMVKLYGKIADTVARVKGMMSSGPGISQDPSASGAPQFAGGNMPTFGGGKSGGGSPAETVTRLNTELEKMAGFGSQLNEFPPLATIAAPETIEALDLTNEKLAALNETAAGSLQVIGEGFQNLFGAFAAAFASGKNVLSQMLDYFKKWAAAMIAKLLAVALAAFILSRLFPGLGGAMGGFKGIFKNLGGFGGGAGAMKNLGGLSNMASGTGGISKFGGLVAEVSGDKLNFVMSEYDRKRGSSY